VGNSQCEYSDVAAFMRVMVRPKSSKSLASKFFWRRDDVLATVARFEPLPSGKGSLGRLLQEFEAN